MNQRLSSLRNILKKKDMSSAVLSYPANISYLTGFPTEDSCLFLNDCDAYLLTDFRYCGEYIKRLKGSDIKLIEIEKSLMHTLKKFKVKNIAFEKKHISLSFYEMLKSVFAKKLIPAEDVVERLRLIKEKQEIDLIKKAIAINLDAFEYIKRILKPGIKEIEVAAEIERYIRYKGATKSSFDIIVASGINSSFPHAKISHKIIRKNEPIIIDMGVDYQGYKSDLTRVFFLGKMDTLFKRVKGIVETALDKAKKAIKPGIPINYIDKQARNFIKSKSFGDCFRHSLGHGVGLEVHELPKIYAKNKEKLQSGMVFTLEPAIYLNNKFGVRIEEMVLVTDKGAEVLSGSGN